MRLTNGRSSLILTRTSRISVGFEPRSSFQGGQKPAHFPLSPSSRSRWSMFVSYLTGILYLSTSTSVGQWSHLGVTGVQRAKLTSQSGWFSFPPPFVFPRSPGKILLGVTLVLVVFGFGFGSMISVLLRPMEADLCPRPGCIEEPLLLFGSKRLGEVGFQVLHDQHSGALKAPPGLGANPKRTGVPAPVWKVFNTW